MRFFANISFVLLYSACGSLASRGGDSDHPAQTAPETAPPLMNSKVDDSSSILNGLQDIPVETFLVGGEIATRINSDTLVIQFRSNVADATFDCQVDQAGGEVPCLEGSQYTFSNLAQGTAHSLMFRAKGPDGRRDETPVTVSFVVDRSAVQPAVTAPPAVTTAAKVDPKVLPARIDETTPAKPGLALSRELMVGSSHSVVVPYSMQVGSYATTKTDNGRMRLLYAMGAGLTTNFALAGCSRDFEAPVNMVGDTKYCEATPTRQDYMTKMPAPLPYNHLELVNAPKGKAVEKLLVAAFDNDTDPFEKGLGLDGICASAQARGQVYLPVLKSFSALMADREMLRWCQVRGGDGQWWWVGFVATRTAATPSMGRLRMIYSVSSARGVTSSAQFIQRAQSVLGNVVVSLIPQRRS